MLNQPELHADDGGWDLDVLIAKRDRAAATLDRLEAALSRRRAEEQLAQTYRDTLTGALQRAAGRDRLYDEVTRAQRNGTSLVILFLDVVGLKGINDSLGHAAGDLVLASVGSALVAGLRAYDVVVRYGGDEFVCGLPESSLSTATRRLSQIRLRLDVAGPGIALSSGAALLRDAEQLDAVIDRADRAMYDQRRRDAKGRGSLPATVPLRARSG